MRSLLLKPTYIVEYVTDIDLEDLWNHGVRGFIFDLDNTIMAPHSGVLEDHIGDWLKKAQEIGFKLIVVSNNPLSFYTKEAEKTLSMPVLGNAGKPRRKHLRRALEMLDLPPEQVVVVGDRPLTDIWGGIRLGSKTILVDPLTKHKENGLIKCLRWLERLVIHEINDMRQLNK
jgi:uncharacterized protein